MKGLEKVINQIIRLVQPKTFESIMKSTDYSTGNVIVRPSYLSICHADQRYYKGTREKEILQKKLPMALIHEAVGEVQYDPRGEFQSGEKVVLVPSIPGYLFGAPKSESVINEKIGENYCPYGKFRSSGYDGFMQELVTQPRELIVRTNDRMDYHLFSLTELLSVCMHSLKRFYHYSNGNQRTVGVWGDGNVAFLMALLLKKTLPSTKVIIFGKHPEKLEMFSFADDKYLINQSFNGLAVDHVFECVGGQHQSKVINEIIDLIQPGGSISILGVSEKELEINVRKMMEKGIVLIGNSRSSALDFIESIQFMKANGVSDYLNLLASTIVTVSSISDIHQAFEADSVKPFGKTLMKWEL